MNLKKEVPSLQSEGGIFQEAWQLETEFPPLNFKNESSLPSISKREVPSNEFEKEGSLP